MTLHNLETGLVSTKQLSTDLNVPIVADLMGGVAAEAIEKNSPSCVICRRICTRGALTG